MTCDEINDDRAGGHCYTALPGFNDLGRSVTLIFLSMDHFLCRFSTFSEKLKLSIRNLDFLQNAPSNSVIFSSSFICATVSNASSVQ